MIQPYPRFNNNVNSENQFQIFFDANFELEGLFSLPYIAFFIYDATWLIGSIIILTILYIVV